ncbi:unnamed protein product [Porites evermanni]|uniref:Uncharacterized protein n=1 Tax=Porites evermanni TaxID=104178 RepID=A0ABN8S8P3_9CNID|nr:unnamed protein product [Porites evermanni]
MAACSSTSCQKSSKKRLPNSVSDLLDVAIFTFACQTGLRSYHKIRGNPVLEGVCAFFGQLLQTANEETKQELREISAKRLGEWQPGNVPTPQLLTFVSSRIKALKEKQIIKENTNPEVPALLVEKKEKFDEEQDRVRTRTLPSMASPFMEVLEKMLDENEDDHDNSDEEQNMDEDQSGDAGECTDGGDQDYRNLVQSDIDFPDDDDQSDQDGSHDEIESSQ